MYKIYNLRDKVEQRKLIGPKHMCFKGLK